MLETKLTKLEFSILNTMANRTPNDTLAIRSQIKSCVVLDRSNSGAGFYTILRTKNSEKLISAKLIDNIFAHIEGMNNLMTFVLYIENGCIYVLEGASIAENTIGIDFTKDIIFQICES